MRSLPSALSRSSGKIGSPPAISTSSSTQRIPEISGSSHSSKNTRGRRRRSFGAPAARIVAPGPRRRARDPASASAVVRAARPARRRMRIIWRISATLRWLKVYDGIAAADQLARDVGLQIGERQHQVGLQRLDLVEPRVDERRDLRLLPRLRRTHGIAGHADDAIALTEQVERLGRLLGQADDAGWVVWHWEARDSGRDGGSARGIPCACARRAGTRRASRW